MLKYKTSSMSNLCAHMFAKYALLIENYEVFMEEKYLGSELRGSPLEPNPIIYKTTKNTLKNKGLLVLARG